MPPACRRRPPTRRATEHVPECSGSGSSTSVNRNRRGRKITEWSTSPARNMRSTPPSSITAAWGAGRIDPPPQPSACASSASCWRCCRATTRRPRRGLVLITLPQSCLFVLARDLWGRRRGWILAHRSAVYLTRSAPHHRNDTGEGTDHQHNQQRPRPCTVLVNPASQGTLQVTGRGNHRILGIRPDTGNQAQLVETVVTTYSPTTSSAPLDPVDEDGRNSP